MIEVPIYFLTCTTYGTWLPGDDRHWVDRKESGPNVPYRERDPERRERAGALLKSAPVILTSAERQIVAATIREVCTHKGWRLLAVNCRTNHVHVVVRAPDVSPEFVMNAFKSWASRRLNEATDRADRPRRWTRHGSTRWLDTEGSVHAAIRYVEEGQ
jgi:REP element-mobilizing transposase RayT